MATGPTISMQKILAASQGNPDLREVLDAVNQVSSQTQTATSTTAVSGTTAGQPNSSAARPKQATGTVSLLNGSYIVQLVNPGGQSAISQLQAAESAQSATAQTSVQPVTPIYHQIRVSTTRAFNVNSNTQTFGGDTGSTQTYWTLTGLGSGTWYVQFRSSFDGVNWNSWKNANGGTASGGLVSQVTVLTASYSDWALFQLPGSLLMGIGGGLVPDQGIMGIPSGYPLYSSGLIAISGPNGFGASPDSTYGIVACDVAPDAGGGGATGILDYPVKVSMKWGYSGYTVGGKASVFGISFDPSSDKITIYNEGTTNGASWVKLQLPGGSHIVIGQGKNLGGGTIWTPPIPWLDTSRMMSICCLTDQLLSPPGPGTINGIYVSRLNGFVLDAQYQNDTGGAGGQELANWMVIAWEAGAPVEMVGGFSFLKIQLQSGQAVILGAGQVASGMAVALPSGYTSDNMLSVCTPASADTGHRLVGVQQCSFNGLTPTLIYTDNINIWSGKVNWLLAAWK